MQGVSTGCRGTGPHACQASGFSAGRPHRPAPHANLAGDSMVMSRQPSAPGPFCVRRRHRSRHLACAPRVPSYRPLVAGTEAMSPHYVRRSRAASRGGSHPRHHAWLSTAGGCDLLYAATWLPRATFSSSARPGDLSTTVLCRAVRDAARGARVVSVDISPDFHTTTRRAVNDVGLTAQLISNSGRRRRGDGAPHCC